jgi:hypothetical protein
VAEGPRRRPKAGRVKSEVSYCAGFGRMMNSTVHVGVYCVYICIYMFVFMYVCTYVCNYVCTYACT